MRQEDYVNDAVELLKRLIATPSVSRNETAAADIMEKQMITYGLAPHREANNVWVLSSDWDDTKPTLLLNAHIDTVKPVDSWIRDPFKPTLEGDKLYGLGSNDCGGGLTTLLQGLPLALAPAAALQLCLPGLGRRGGVGQRWILSSPALVAEDRRRHRR